MTAILESTIVGRSAVFEKSEAGVPQIVGSPIFGLPTSELKDETPVEQGDAPISALGSLGDHAYRLLEPIAMDLYREDESFVAAWRDTEEFGYGTSAGEAIRDLQLSIIEVFQELEASNDAELSSDLQALRDFLRRYVAVAE